jgi:hypothetical protein
MPGTWFALRRALACATLAASAGLVLAACSPGGDYPSLFPSVHDTPPPRSDTPLNSTQVQQATEDLISARDRLSAEAQAGQGKNGAAANPAVASANSATKPAGKSAAKSAAKSPAKSLTTSAANSRPNAAAANPATASAPARKQPATPVSAEQSPQDDPAGAPETK